MKWKLTALLTLLAIGLLALVFLMFDDLTQTILRWPPQRVAGGVLLGGLLIWMWLYERHRSRHPQQRFLSSVLRGGKVIVKRSVSGRLHRKRPL